MLIGQKLQIKWGNINSKLHLRFSDSNPSREPCQALSYPVARSRTGFELHDCTPRHGSFSLILLPCDSDLNCCNTMILIKRVSSS